MPFTSRITMALEYLENVGSDIRVNQFDDDFKPIGPSLRSQLNQKGLIEEFDGWIGLVQSYPATSKSELLI